MVYSSVGNWAAWWWCLTSKTVRIRHFSGVSTGFLLATLYTTSRGDQIIYRLILIKILMICYEKVIRDKSNYHTGRFQCQLFKALFQLYGFKQIIKGVTCITRDSSTLIDLMTTNNPSAISNYVAYPTSLIILSHHDTDGCIRKLCQIVPKWFHKCKLVAYICHKKCKCGVKTFQRYSEKYFWPSCPAITKKMRGKPCSSLNSEIRKSMIDRDRMLRKPRRTKDEKQNTESWEILVIIC